MTIQKVAKESFALWRYQRFLLVDEYRNKSPLPPPFNIVYYVFTAAYLIFKYAQQYKNKHRRNSLAMFL